MHPLLSTLDPTDPAGSASSVHDLHPIRDAASARSRGIPFLLSLGLTPLLIYGLSISLISPASLRAVQGALDQARRSVSFQLNEPDPPGVKPPARNPVGPAGPGGAGHRGGTGTLDPRLAAYTSILSQPSDAIDPETLGPSPKAERVDLSLNPALPLQAGGNGLARGTGRDSALGSGGLIRPPKVLDFKLIPTRQVTVQHQLAPGEESATRQPLRVRILIGEDGVPTQATVVSGPDFLHEKALKAALEWRFEPLVPHGLRAPLSLTLLFHPLIQNPRGGLTSRSGPVPIRQVTLTHRLHAGEAMAKEPSVVRLLIAADGVPYQAIVVSGPVHLHDEAIKAALEWRFEPLARQGLKAPYPFTVTFTDSFQEQR